MDEVSAAKSMLKYIHSTVQHCQTELSVGGWFRFSIRAKFSLTAGIGDKIIRQNLSAENKRNTFCFSIMKGLGAYEKRYFKYLDVTGSNIDICTVLPNCQTFSVIRYGNTNCYYIKYTSSLNDTQNIVVSSSDLGAASLWSFEAVYAIDAPLYLCLDKVCGGNLPMRFRGIFYFTRGAVAVPKIIWYNTPVKDVTSHETH